MLDANLLLHWVKDLLDEVTNPVFIEENGLSDAEQMVWLRGQVAKWEPRLREYWEYLDSQRPERDPVEDERVADMLLNSPGMVRVTKENFRELMFPDLA